MQPKEVVHFNEFLAEWSRCLTGQYQRDRLYRFGKLDDCGLQWQDLITAFKAKWSKDKDEALRLLDTTHHHRSQVSSTAGVIWELKETPGWE